MLSKCCVINPKKCNNNSYLFNICFNHFKLSYHKYIIIIQAYYKGYKCRKYLKIFNILPNDIQSKIINYINRDYNYYKYKYVLNNVIFNYVGCIHNYMYRENSSINIKLFIKGYKLYNKYFKIIGINYLKHFFTIGYHIHKYIDEYMNGSLIDVINLIYSYPVLCKIDVNNVNNDDMKILKTEILKFNILYYKSFYRRSNDNIYS